MRVHLRYTGPFRRIVESSDIYFPYLFARYASCGEQFAAARH